MRDRIIFIIGAFVIAGHVTSTASGERLQLRVTPSVSTAPGTIVVTATVPKHADNRMLGIGAESVTFYRSSEIQLDGDRAPLVTQVRLKNLPSGDYTVVAVLRDSGGNETSVARKAVVLGAAGERQ